MTMLAIALLVTQAALASAQTVASASAHALSCPTFCRLLREDFNAGGCEELEGQNEANEQLVGFKLKAKSDGFLNYLGHTFPDASGNPGDVTPINVCLLALYGDSPMRLGPLPTSESFYSSDRDYCSAQQEPHWFGACEANQEDRVANADCTNDTPLFNRFTYGEKTYQWSRQFCRGSKDAAQGCISGDLDYPTEEITCYFKEYPDCRGRIRLGVESGDNIFGRLRNVMTNKGANVEEGNPIVQLPVRDDARLRQASQWIISYTSETSFRLHYLPNPSYVMGIDINGQKPVPGHDISRRKIVLQKNSNYVTQQWRVDGNQIVSLYRNEEVAQFGFVIWLDQQSDFSFAMRARHEESSLLSVDDPDSNVFTTLPDTFNGFEIEGCHSMFTFNLNHGEVQVLAVEDTGSLPMVGQPIEVQNDLSNFDNPFQCWWWIHATGNPDYPASEHWYQIVPQENQALALAVNTIGPRQGVPGDLILQALGTRPEQYWRPSESMYAGNWGEFEVHNGLTYEDHLINIHSDLVNGAELSMVFNNATNTSRIDFNSPFHEETMEWFIIRQ